MRLTDEQAERAPDCPPPEWYEALAQATYDETLARCWECDGVVDPDTWERWRKAALTDPEPAPLAHDTEENEDEMSNPNVLYEKCAECHLFVEPNDVAPIPGMEIAEYVHLHRGTEDDERLDETHEAKPSGARHDLDFWKKYGPHEMRARFIR